MGKTSTKEMIAAVLSQKYNTLKTQGNFNNELGLPLTVFRLREEHEIAVLEMGISDFGRDAQTGENCQTRHLCDNEYRFVSSGISQVQEMVLKKAKTEIFDYLRG